MSQQPNFKFNPYNKALLSEHFPSAVFNPEYWRDSRHTDPWMFNPWTGEPRDDSDIESDPYGLLIYDPAWGPLQAAVKDSNPKDAIGDTKVPLWLLSPVAEAHWALAQFAGMSKYGLVNWRVSGVRSSVYLSAMRRHMAAYLAGEETDPVDGTHHLGNIMACCAIILDAGAAGKLTDDRPLSIDIRSTYEMIERMMVTLKAKYGDKNPKHWHIGGKP